MIRGIEAGSGLLSASSLWRSCVEKGEEMALCFPRSNGKIFVGSKR